MKFGFGFALAGLMLAALAPAPMGAPALARVVIPAGAPQSGLRKAPLTITTKKGAVHFTVEVAASFAEQEHGMMFRRAVPPSSGMIFPVRPARPVSFWMKNTLVPLDILFIRDDGSIARIADNARPLSLDPIDSGEPVVAVLEIAGGRAAAAGITEGDKVRW